MARERARTSSAGGSSSPSTFALAVPGEHNRRNAAAALEALVRVGVDADAAEAALCAVRRAPTGASSSSASAAA